MVAQALGDFMRIVRFVGLQAKDLRSLDFAAIL